MQIIGKRRGMRGILRTAALKFLRLDAITKRNIPYLSLRSSLINTECTKISGLVVNPLSDNIQIWSYPREQRTAPARHGMRTYLTHTSKVFGVFNYRFQQHSSLHSFEYPVYLYKVGADHGKLHILYRLETDSKFSPLCPLEAESDAHLSRRFTSNLFKWKGNSRLGRSCSSPLCMYVVTS